MAGVCRLFWAFLLVGLCLCRLSVSINVPKEWQETINSICKEEEKGLFPHPSPYAQVSFGSYSASSIGFQVSVSLAYIMYDPVRNLLCVNYLHKKSCRDTVICTCLVSCRPAPSYNPIKLLSFLRRRGWRARLGHILFANWSS